LELRTDRDSKPSVASFSGIKLRVRLIQALGTTVVGSDTEIGLVAKVGTHACNPDHQISVYSYFGTSASCADLCKTRATFSLNAQACLRMYPLAVTEAAGRIVIVFLQMGTV
jgi:hypothetical protein